MNFYEMLTEVKGSAPIFGDMFSFKRQDKLCVFEDDKAWCALSFPKSFIEHRTNTELRWSLRGREWDIHDRNHFGPLKYIRNLVRPSWEDL